MYHGLDLVYIHTNFRRNYELFLYFDTNTYGIRNIFHAGFDENALSLQPKRFQMIKVKVNRID